MRNKECLQGRSASRGGLHPGEWSAYRGVLHPGGSLGIPPQGLPMEVGQTQPRDTLDTMGYGQQAGGMHPAEMHSCLVFLIHKIDIGIRASIDTDVHKKLG